MKISFINNFWALRYIWNVNKNYVICSYINAVVIYIKYIYVHTILPGFLINMTINKCSFKTTIIVFSFYFIFILYDILIGTYYTNVLKENSHYILSSQIQKDIFKKIINISITAYDNPKFYNEYMWIVTNGSTKVNDALEISVGIISSLISFLINYTIIIKLSPISLVLIFSGVLMSFLFTKIKTKLNYSLNEKILNTQNENIYIDNVFYFPDYAKELRISNVKEILYGRHNKIFKIISKLLKKSMLKRFFTSLGINSIYIIIIQTFLYIYYVFIVLNNTDISSGDFIIMITSTTSIFNILISLVELISKLHENGLYINKFKNFFHHMRPQSEAALDINTYRTINFQNVTFSYPNNKFLLTNINIQIKYGDKIAILGDNGSGKTTFIKLLLGLYTPTYGNITIDDNDITHYSQSQYRKLFNVVFQDFKCYPVTIAENILMRDIENKRHDEQIVYTALKLSGLYEKINTLSHGIYSIVGKEFDSEGVIFSGGEMQKLAIARIYASDCDIIVLDEASASLDIISRDFFYQQFFQHFKEKTIIFVSHKYEMIKFVDKILFFSNGSIVEHGRHDELIKLNGLYAKKYNSELLKTKEFFDE